MRVPSVQTQSKMIFVVGGAGTTLLYLGGIVPPWVPFLTILMLLFILPPMGFGYWQSWKRGVEEACRDYVGWLKDLQEQWRKPVVALSLGLIAAWSIFLLYAPMNAMLRVHLALWTALVLLAILWYAAESWKGTRWARLPIWWMMWPLWVRVVSPLLLLGPQDHSPLEKVAFLMVMSSVGAFCWPIIFIVVVHVPGWLSDWWKHSQRLRRAKLAKI